MITIGPLTFVLTDRCTCEALLSTLLVLRLIGSPQLFSYSSSATNPIHLPIHSDSKQPSDNTRATAHSYRHSRNMADPNAPVASESFFGAPGSIESGGASIWDSGHNNDIPSLVNLFETSPETVCDFGDIILNVDDGYHPAVKIQVSSCILATASKVFKALFSNRFAEGHALRAEHQSPSEILIKDTPKDLLLLCKLLHWQGDSRPSSHRQLRGFALTVDKYDCVEAMRHIS